MKEPFVESITALVTSLNNLVHQHEFERFLQIRKDLQGKQRRHKVIFNVNRESVCESEGWAFHTGGREELQFNVGIEHELNRFRFGVAFSLELSRSLISLEPLRPKIIRFNEFLRNSPSSFEEYRMWIWREKRILKTDTAVRQITEDEICVGNFVFMGKTVALDAVDINEILDTFSELLDLYTFVESLRESPGSPQFFEAPPFLFQEGVTIGVERSDRSGSDSISVTHHSNQIKTRLLEYLMSEPNIKLGDEIPSGNGGKIDLVGLLASGTYDFYEIKPAAAAKHAIREALPQLLEYAYRRGGVEANRLVIVSQASLDRDSDLFLSNLRERGLPIHYLHVPLE